MNQRKTLQIMYVNVTVGEKRREKTFMEEFKTFEPKATVKLPMFHFYYIICSINYNSCVPFVCFLDNIVCCY